MCGIAGLVDFAGIDPATADSRIRCATARIACRGPDDRGHWSDPYCILAHTRLSIIDLSPLGAQPMQRDDLVISFNGEIFNYAELRKELAGLGHLFRSHSDTEVLLAGWRQWGERLLPRLVGMFAFAIWDARSRILFAARDRFGEKPLVYAHADRRVAFGSDLVACEAMLDEKRPLDPAALRALFTLRFIPEPVSIAAGVRKLPPGHWMRFGDNGLSVAPWYQLAIERPPRPRDHAESLAELRRRFDAAVAARLVADVPVGVFLSGGIDSSLVAASVATTGAKLKTFTVGFDGAAEYYEERPQAATTARHLGAEHCEIAVGARRAGEVLDKVFEALDEPFADSSAVPTFLVSEATRREVSVVLTGDGADEVFGGYRRYWSELYINVWQYLPRPLRSLAQGVLAALPEGKHHPLLEIVRRARRFADTGEVNPVDRQAGWMRLMPEHELDALFAPAPVARMPLEETIASLRASIDDDDPINAMLACDLALELPADMLVKVDRMSMVHALETRAPFLDQRVVEWAFAMPGSDKLALLKGQPVGKRVLREAFRDRLPAEVFSRPKRGFEMPVAQLLAGPAADHLAAVTDRGALIGQGLFDPDVVQCWKDNLTTGRRDTTWHLWTMLAFQEWARLHRRPEAISR